MFGIQQHFRQLWVQWKADHIFACAGIAIDAKENHTPWKKERQAGATDRRDRERAMSEEKR